MKRKKLRLSGWQYLAIGYLAVILFGSVLLILPFATAKGEHTDYVGALFTSASMVSITGLSPYDTGTHWTLFGQIVILIFSQMGALGFMVFVTTAFMLLGKGMGLGSRSALMTDAGVRKLSGVKSLVKKIIIGTFLFEFIGACLLAIRFVANYGWGRGLWFSLWTSVMSFCNAGFDLMGSVGESSLSRYATDPLVSLTVCALIILGGLGFCIWGDVYDCHFRYKKFQLNTKVVLGMSLILLIVGTVLYTAFDWNIPAYENFNFGQKLLASFFNSTTARTAGFYVVNPVELSESGYLLTVVLMFIGGGTGSTAGGLRVGTFAVIIFGMVAAFRGKRDINIGKKRIEHSLLSQALAIFTAILMLIIMATLIILAIEMNSNLTFEQVLFEVVSGLSTTGLSYGATAAFSAGSLCIMMILMYLGRVGILTFAFALSKKRPTTELRKPVDTLLIG